MGWYSILWSPWRAEYIKRVSRNSNKDCFICEAVKNPNSPENLTLLLKGNVIILLNKYPYNSGHLMVAPIRHVKNIEDLTQDEWTEISKAIVLSKKLLDVAYKPDGYNIGANLGKAAGAGLEDHLHFHIVPRWIGDASFMTVIGATKVIPQSLEDTLKELKEILKNLI
ncbi:MAG: HIT domain-containing protein [Thermoproteota archaeon]|nr:HIT domain-containing protein [Thermoproteota archaeon]